MSHFCTNRDNRFWPGSCIIVQPNEDLSWFSLHCLNVCVGKGWETALSPWVDGVTARFTLFSDVWFRNIKLYPWHLSDLAILYFGSYFLHFYIKRKVELFYNKSSFHIPSSTCMPYPINQSHFFLHTSAFEVAGKTLPTIVLNHYPFKYCLFNTHNNVISVKYDIIIPMVDYSSMCDHRLEHMGYLEESVEERRRRRGRALNVQDTGDRHGGGGRQTERGRD